MGWPGEAGLAWCTVKSVSLLYDSLTSSDFSVCGFPGELTLCAKAGIEQVMCGAVVSQ